MINLRLYPALVKAKQEEEELNRIAKQIGAKGVCKVILRDWHRQYFERQYIPSEEERRVQGESMRILRQVLKIYRESHPDWADPAV